MQQMSETPQVIVKGLGKTFTLHNQDGARVPVFPTSNSRFFRGNVSSWQAHRAWENPPCCA